MSRVARVGVVTLLLSCVWSATALAGDGPMTEAPAVSLSRSIPDLHLSVSEEPGETTIRLPLASESTLLYGLLSPYLSLGSTTALGVPWNTMRAPGLKREPDGLDDVRLGAGVALPLSERAQLYGEYRFLRGRLDGGLGRSMLQREPDSSDFRAGVSIRLD